MAKRKYVNENTAANYKKFKSTGGFKRSVPNKYRTGGFFMGNSKGNELKTVDTSPADYGCNSTGSITLLNGVATGTDFTDRIGRKIIMKSVSIQGYLYPEDSNVTENLARIMLVYDSQSNQAAPAMTDILKTSTALSQLNLNNRERFRVLYDSFNAMAGQNYVTATLTYAGSPTTALVKQYIKLNHDVIYSGTTAAAASIQTGGLYLVTVGIGAVGTGQLYGASARVRFIDA